MNRAIIIDDESSGREILAGLLARHTPQIEVVDSAGSVAGGIQAILDHNPDIVFLDVEMPSGTGFDVLEALDTMDFEVIFITAYDQYAISAFKFSAIDYLLKPVNVDQLKDAVGRAMKQRALRKEDDRIKFLLEQLNTRNTSNARMMVSTIDGFQILKIPQIIRCESDGNYTNFHQLDTKPLLVSKPMKEFEPVLSKHGFFRVHRSHLINMEHVVRYIKGKGGEVEMVDGAVLSVSRERKDDFLSRLL